MWGIACWIDALGFKVWVAYRLCDSISCFLDSHEGLLHYLVVRGNSQTLVWVDGLSLGFPKLQRLSIRSPFHVNPRQRNPRPQSHHDETLNPTSPPFKKSTNRTGTASKPRHARALIIRRVVWGAPYYNYSTSYPQAPFWLLRHLRYRTLVDPLKNPFKGPLKKNPYSNS